MSDDSPSKRKMVTSRPEHFAEAITEFNYKMKIKSRLAYFDGDDRIVADALIYLQNISTLDS